MLLCTLYILVGLALTGTIIELVRRQYAESWQRLQALRGLLSETLKKFSEQTGAKIDTSADISASNFQSDLKKIITVMSLSKLRPSASSKNRQLNVRIPKNEWEDAVQTFIRDFKNSQTTSTSLNSKKPILQIIIYESSV